MTARAFVLLADTLLVEQYGQDAVDEWRASVAVDEVADRRRNNLMAALMLDGEVG